MADRPPDSREVGRLVAMSQVGMEMVVPLGIGLIVDYYAGSKPWGVIIGTILGFVGGISHLVLLANRQNEESERPGGEKR